MSTQTAREIDTIPRIDRTGDAAALAGAVYERLFVLLEQLDADDWRSSTECVGWDVAAMVGHLIGAAKACASVRELAHQQWWGQRHRASFGGNSLDAANHLQVVEHHPLSPAQRLAALRAIAPDAVRGRMRLPRVLRAGHIPLDAGGSTAPGSPRTLSLGELMDVIFTRDVWLHTIDISRATGRQHVPDVHVDGRVVEDVVADWARRHAAPVRLELTGPVGGRYRQGAYGPELRLDAIDFCRVLSGRATTGDSPGDVAVDTSDEKATLLLETRVVF